MPEAADDAAAAAPAGASTPAGSAPTPLRSLKRHSTRRRIAAACALIALIAGSAIWRRFTAPPPPLEISFWYWHQPFQLKPNDRALLRKIGVRRLFVRAGTFHRSGDRLRLTLPQRWATDADTLAIHLVFNFDSSVIQAFSSLDNAAIADAVILETGRTRRAAESAGLHVTGLQLDLDSPTSRLEKYGDLLHRIRLKAPALQLSITALPSWYRSPHLDAVLREIDFAAPQFYEATVGRTRSDYVPVADVAKARAGLSSAGWQGRPFFAGIPVYGHALVYNGAGRLVGAYHDRNVCEVMRHPAFRNLPTVSGVSGEDLYEFEALIDANDGQGRGYRLIYDVPTPETLRLHLAALRSRPGNCLGAILFRYPEEGATAVLPVAATAALLHGEPAEPTLRVDLNVRSAPWEQLEAARPSRGALFDVSVSVSNVGASGTFVAPDAVAVTLALHHSAIDEIVVHDCDHAETLFNPDGKPSVASPALRASAARSNVLSLRRIYLGPGETRLLATLRLRSAGSDPGLRGVWTARCPGGRRALSGPIGPYALR